MMSLALALAAHVIDQINGKSHCALPLLPRRLGHGVHVVLERDGLMERAVRISNQHDAHVRWWVVDKEIPTEYISL
jgi:hypothetical protein